jgi:predicted AlkP superfamily phosphohydrolase/phosphomutase
VGHGGLYLSENDTGPDDSVHSMDGVMMVYDPHRDSDAKEIHGADVLQVAPVLLRALGLDPAEEGIEERVPVGLMDYVNK